MPLEKRPHHPLPKGERPASRLPPHRVTDEETLESVARKFGVSYRHLVMHNFGTVDEREINWYLREHVGCTLPTRDGRNWRFSSAAKPGLIYIPMTVIHGEPIMVLGKVPPVNLGDVSHPMLLASDEFVLEFTFPASDKEPADLGYFLARARFNLIGQIKQIGGPPLKVAVKKDQIKLVLEHKLIDETKMAFGFKVDDKSLEPIADALKSGSLPAFKKAILAPFEISIKTAYHVGPYLVVPEIGLEASKTPVIARIAGEWEGPMLIESSMFRGKFAIKVGFNVGLSAKGWALVAKKVGPDAVRKFLAQGGRALMSVGQWLLSEGVLVTAGAAGVAGAFLLGALTMWVTDNKRQKGEMYGIVYSWYVQTYVAMVFGKMLPSFPTPGYTPEQLKSKDELFAMGQRDAITDARSAFLNSSDPRARGSDSEVLASYRDVLIAQSGGSSGRAEAQLREAVLARARRIMGL